jgi:hypothetical protein
VTEAQTPAAPPGWYPVAAGQSLQRYWDGTVWTEHTYDPTPQPLRAPDGTNTNTLWIWLLCVGGPVASMVLIVLEGFWLRSIANVDFTNPTATTSLVDGPIYLLLAGGGWIVIGLLVVVGWLDYRRLRAAGVPNPFHWAWSFLGGIVYVIGRSIVVKRRTGGGLTPLWVFIALEAAAIVLSFVVLVIALSAIFQAIANSTGIYSGA